MGSPIMKRRTNTMRTKTLAFLLGVLAVVGCEDDLVVPDFNNPSIEELTTNPTPTLVNTAAQGLLVGVRAQAASRNGYTSLLGILGRESYNFDGSDPRFITEMLEGALDAGSPAFGANLWNLRYQNIRNANIVLNALDVVQGLSQQELAGIRGFARTIQALDLLMVINTRDSNGAVIDTNRPVDADPAPIVGKDEAFAEISRLLDEAQGDLQAGGSAFSFSLSSGFSGFDTPTSFVQFNRALKARVELYRGNHSAALGALSQSFLDPDGDLDTGIYHVFSTGGGDALNALYDPGQTPDILAHPSAWEQAELKSNGDRDDRVTGKMRQVPAQTQLGITTGFAFTIYDSNSASVPIIRNEELILIRAEANMALGNIAEAAEDLNLIRTRSGGLEERTDLDASNIEDELLRQRWFSLLFEGGHRWLDMRRFGRLSELPLDVTNHRHNDRFPIPEAETLARQGG
jgi:hypothetical protein